MKLKHIYLVLAVSVLAILICNMTFIVTAQEQELEDLGVCGGEVEPLATASSLILLHAIRRTALPWVGTHDGSVIRLTQDSYELCTGGFAQGTVNAFVEEDDTLFVGVDDPERRDSGVWRLLNRRWENIGLAETAVYDLCSTGTSLFAATLDDVFTTSIDNIAWERVRVGYPGAPHAYHTVYCSEGRLALVGAKDEGSIFQPIYEGSEIVAWRHYDRITSGTRQMVSEDDQDIFIAAGRLYRLNLLEPDVVEVLSAPSVDLISVDVLGDYIAVGDGLYGAWISDNGGQNWLKVTDLAAHSVEFRNGVLYIGTDRGLVRHPLNR